MKERFPQPGLLGCVALFIQTVSASRPITQKNIKKSPSGVTKVRAKFWEWFSIAWTSISIAIMITHPVWRMGITAPEVKKKQEILNSPFWNCLGFLRRTLPAPAEYFIVNLQRRNFHVLGSCAARCRFLHGSPWGNCSAGTSMSWVPAPHVAGSCTAVYRETAAQELSCLGFLRRLLPVPARKSIGKLQRRSFHVLGSCTAGCRFLRGSL